MTTMSVLVCGLALLLLAQPSLQNLNLNRNGVCFEKTWQCYGAHTSRERDYWLVSAGPQAYVDGQETTTIGGHVAELEYAAHITGVKVTFFIMELVEKDVENTLKITHTITHVANKTGLIKIPLDIHVKSKSRIGFEVTSGAQIPMYYRPGKKDGSNYKSFMARPENGDIRTFPSRSVNRQYNFRICFDLARNEILCPYTAAPIVDPCTPNPCLNGECIRSGEGEHGYKCRCHRGYEGERCENAMGPCYRKFWQCFGGHTSLPEQFTLTSMGNMAYVDGQSTTTISGHVSELEYVADVVGVEVTFMVLELDESKGKEKNGRPKENMLRLVHRVHHTATKTGLVKIPVDWEVKRRSRIGFEVFGKDNQVPMKYRIGKLDGNHYKSFIGLPGSTSAQAYPKESVNRQYNFRMCFDLRRDEVLCPYIWTA